MNKRVITLLTGAMMAANEDDNNKALRLAAEAVAELSMMALDDAEAVAKKTSKVVPAEKQPDRGEHGTRPKAKRQHAPKVLPETRDLIWVRFNGGEKPAQLAKAFGLAKSTIGNILVAKKREHGIPVRPAYFGSDRRTSTTA